MVELDKYELHALHKLLGAVKFSEKIDSYDLNEFANSPLNTSILKKVREEHIRNQQAAGNSDLIEKWLENIKFRFESETGKAIPNLLRHLSPSSLETLGNLKKEELQAFAIGLVEPLHSETVEIEKLSDFIKSLAKEKV
ncbi:hypothetical protein [Pontibacter beigongshangensis]|uniref:hypothetical protein n=1 Tax=Pontibacter beigongshangensis TaxID=2574733 RepID=UPI00164F9892|nr:hypothetical protein [Pontibacter beigongshangensis]